MDAEERHGFEGDGFTYLKSPVWWAGIIACIDARPLHGNILLTAGSNHWRNRKLRSICICACDSSHTSGGTQCADRSGARFILSEGGIRDVGEAWVCDLPDRVGDHRFTCSSGQRNRDGRRDSTSCHSAW